ncbi:hypothetical protein KIN20_009964 [Parelaphostrongylus tenuis]|uniref:Uncharacterized protein n=1 Tax=Parelaphostrongylus tenuis TaxID=148309 RepID=A0AAD5M760_PARTN|nr:hypothetical protein KIN20_009964 [Parelaphostrongylus tenuis]
MAEKNSMSFPKNGIRKIKLSALINPQGIRYALVFNIEHRLSYIWRSQNYKRANGSAVLTVRSVHHRKSDELLGFKSDEFHYIPKLNKICRRQKRKLFTNLVRSPIVNHNFTASYDLGSVWIWTMPPDQESTRTFNVTGLTTLPVAMAYSSTAGIQNPGIATNEAGARGFVERLVVQNTILGQLRVQVTYKPLNCDLIVGPDAMLSTDSCRCREKVRAKRIRRQHSKCSVHYTLPHHSRPVRHDDVSRLHSNFHYITSSYEKKDQTVRVPDIEV